MDKIRQIELVNELIENVKREILAKCNRFPENWDGNELRWYVADRFEKAARRDRNEMRARLRNYKNDMIVRDL